MATNKRINKAYVRFDGTGRIIPGSLILNRFKPAVGNWKETPAYECCNPILRLLFSNITEVNAIIGDVFNVSDWNTYFDLPAYGSPFTLVSVTGNEVKLYGGSNIIIKESLFDQEDKLGTYLLEVDDAAGCIIEVEYDGFGEDGWYGCKNVSYMSLPALITAGNKAFDNLGGDTPMLTMNLPLITTAGNNCFSNCPVTTLDLPQLVIAGSYSFSGCNSLTTINLPSCIQLGADNLSYSGTFDTINNNIVSLNINTALTTCLYGSPHIDIITLAANNSLTLNGTYYAPFTGNTGNLAITFDNITNVPVGNPNNVNDWNNFFDLPPNSTPFSSVNVSGNLVTLYGGENIVFKQSLFSNNIYIISMSDTGCVVFANQSVFSYTNINSLNLINLKYVLTAFVDATSSLVSLNLPNLIYANGFSNSNLASINLPDVKYVGYFCFGNTNSLTSINLPSCQNLGSTVGNNDIFFGITGQTITLTIPSALMTCNAGNPDGDIQYLQANNTVTIITT